jgi:prephenate dehydrogenase
MSIPFKRVTVLGTGLIGGSFALAIRAALPGVSITGWDRPEVLRRARALGVVDEGCSDMAAALSRADLVYVALPVGLTIERLPEIARAAAPGALVTDAASTKRLVCEAAKECFKGGALFLGGHPMAGQENSGIESANVALFRGAKYALIEKVQGERLGGAAEPGALHKEPRVAAFLELLKAIGVQPLWMDAATHDRAAAAVSHLPQLLAVALAGLVRQQTDQTGLPLTLAGRGLRDALRLAGSPYGVWRDIILTNTENVEAALDRLIQQVEDLRVHLRSRELEDEFAGANEVYKILQDMQ